MRQIFEIYARGNASLGDLKKFAAENDLTNIFYKGANRKPITKSVIANILINPFYYGEMYVKKYNRYYPHKYQPIISKAIFDQCQRVAESRAKPHTMQKLQKSKKDFVFRGLIKCAVNGRIVSSDRKETKKNKNTYLITWDLKTLQKSFIYQNRIY